MTVTLIHIVRLYLSAVLLMTGMEVLAQATGGGTLYAVLINGGRNRLTNHERYWNDCAFLYRTLRNVYSIPKRNITILMSDGGLLDDDMLRSDGRGFISSPTDLDGDGEPDNCIPASWQAVSATFNDLARQVTANDHLFLFIIDHGGIEAETGYPYVWLWNNEQLYDYMLSSLLNQIQVKSVCMLLGQCYAGGFMAGLIHNGYVAMAACSADEQSWACPDRPYDEFIYHWICAVNGADEAGNTVDADANGDGRITMSEAFNYARQRDRRPETPLYASMPYELGERWTLNGLLDTAIRDISTGDGTSDEATAYSLAGIRQVSPKQRQLTIVRQGGKMKKVIK